MTKAPSILHVTDREAAELLDQATDQGSTSIGQMPLITVDEQGQVERVPKPAVMRLHDELDHDHLTEEAATQTTVAHLYADGRKGLEPIDRDDDVDEARYVVITQQIVVDLQGERLTDEVHDLMDQMLSFPRLKKLEAQRAAIEDDIAGQQELWDAANAR